MRAKTAIILAATLMVLVTALAGCAAEEDGGKVTVKIGLTTPLSGPGGGYGKDIKAGLDMAAADINAAGGLTIGETKHRCEILAAGDEGSPEGGLAKEKRVMLQGDVKNN